MELTLSLYAEEYLITTRALTTCLQTSSESLAIAEGAYAFVTLHLVLVVHDIHKQVVGMVNERIITWSELIERQYLLCICSKCHQCYYECEY